jgi:hypothetical protein
MFAVATTENAARSFCLINTTTREYVRKDNGNLRTFKTREQAAKAALAINEARNGD